MEPRVSQNGSMETYHQQMAQEYENILLSDEDRIPGQWNTLGPVTGTTGPLAELGIITSLLVEDDQNIYAGTGASGLFVTHNGGTTWTSLTDKYLITGIESIIKVNPDTIYIATGFDTWGKVYSKGVMRSVNNGLSWQNTALDSDYLGGQPFSVRGMVIDPGNSQVLLALVQQEYRKSVKIAKTVDRGEHWIDTYSETGNERDLRKIEYDPFNSHRIMASGRFLLISNNNGDSWQEITQRIPYNDETGQYTIERITTSFHPTIQGRILVMLKKYKGVYTDSFVEFYISGDGGENFTKCQYMPPLPINSASLSEDKFELEWSLSNDHHFYARGIALAKFSLNSYNEIFDLTLPYHCFHDDVRFLKLYKINGDDPNGESRYLDVLYVGNDGGITKGIENTETGMDWIDISGSGLNITQYYGLAINENEPGFYLGGTQDGNLFFHTDDLWYNRGNIGDGGEAVIDYDDPNNIYMVRFCGYEYLYESKDHGLTWHYLATGMPGEGSERRNDAPLEMSKTDPSVLFVGGRDIYKSYDDNGHLIFEKIGDWDETMSFFKSIRVVVV